MDERGGVISSTKSTSDGFYTLPQVLPGRYTLRISPEQAGLLGLRSILERTIEVKPDSDFISGQDLELTTAK